MFFTLKKNCSIKTVDWKVPWGTNNVFSIAPQWKPPFGTFLFKSAVTHPSCGRPSDDVQAVWSALRGVSLQCYLAETCPAGFRSVPGAAILAGGAMESFRMLTISQFSFPWHVSLRCSMVLSTTAHCHLKGKITRKAAASGWSSAIK